MASLDPAVFNAFDEKGMDIFKKVVLQKGMKVTGIKVSVLLLLMMIIVQS